MAEATQDSGTAENTNQQVEFLLQRIYLKDLSFESPQGSQAFLRQWKPKVSQDMHTEINKLDNDNFEVVLHLTITTKDGEDTVYLVEIQQAGIFHIKGLEGQQLTSVLNTHCANILFPYARETVDSLVTKGTFPALMLPPINFDAIYQQALAKREQEMAESTN